MTSDEVFFLKYFSPNWLHGLDIRAIQRLEIRRQKSRRQQEISVTLYRSSQARKFCDIAREDILGFYLTKFWEDILSY